MSYPMTKEEILTDLKTILSATNHTMDPSSVTMDADLFTELGLDSLTLLLMSFSIESKFGVRISPDAKFTKVSDVVDYIALHLA